MTVQSPAHLLVFTTPRSVADESAFDEWYDQVHIPQVVALIPGVVSGRRYVLSPVQLGADTPMRPRRRLTIYEVHPALLADTVTALGDAMRDGSLIQSDLIDRSTAPPEVMAYEAG